MRLYCSEQLLYVNFVIIPLHITFKSFLSLHTACQVLVFVLVGLKMSDPDNVTGFTSQSNTLFLSFI